MNKVVDCPYQVDKKGNLIRKDVDENVIQILSEIKKEVAKLKKYSWDLDKLIMELEENLLRHPNPKWLQENRSRLINDVNRIYELKVEHREAKESKKRKLIIAAKLIDLINA